MRKVPRTWEGGRTNGLARTWEGTRTGEGLRKGKGRKGKEKMASIGVEDNGYMEMKERGV